MRGALLISAVLCLAPAVAAEAASPSGKARGAAALSATGPEPSTPRHLEFAPMRFRGDTEARPEPSAIVERRTMTGVDHRPDPLPPRLAVGPSPDRLPDVTVEVSSTDDGEDGAASSADGDEDDEPSPTSTVEDHWLRLADCESGDWIDGGADFVEGSARWDWAAPGDTVPPWGTRLHHGGLQFHPGTWTWVAGMFDLTEQYPHAYDAPMEVQVRVAERVQELQGWRAWPTCGPLVGLTDP